MLPKMMFWKLVRTLLDLYMNKEMIEKNAKNDPENHYWSSLYTHTQQKFA